MDATEFSGMTVNERLFVSGLLEQFDAAIEAADAPGAVAVLGQVGLADQAEWIVETTLANPGFYGYPRPVTQNGEGNAGAPTP